MLDEKRILLTLMAQTKMARLFGFERCKVGIAGWKLGMDGHISVIQFLVRGKQTMRYLAMRRGARWELIVCEVQSCNV